MLTSIKNLAVISPPDNLINGGYVREKMRNQLCCSQHEPASARMSTPQRVRV
jgi:hypothetical protein